MEEQKTTLTEKETKWNLSIEDIKNSHADTVEFFSRLDFSLITPQGAVKPIKFSEKFDAEPTDYQINYLKALTASQNIGMRVAYKERDEAVAAMNHAVYQKEQADKLVEIHKNNLVNGLQQQNAQVQDQANRIQQLEAELKKREVEVAHLNKQVDLLS